MLKANMKKKKNLSLPYPGHHDIFPQLPLQVGELPLALPQINLEVECALCTVHCALYTVHSALCTACTVHCSYFPVPHLQTSLLLLALLEFLPEPADRLVLPLQLVVHHLHGGHQSI